MRNRLSEPLAWPVLFSGSARFEGSSCGIRKEATGVPGGADCDRNGMAVVRGLALLGSLLATASPAIGQSLAPPRSADNPCFYARPTPACSVFFLTNAGAYIGGTEGGISFRGTVDWGVMVNTSPRNAFGGSWFVTLDEEDEFTTGAVARYRRWLGQGRSLDVAVGTPVAGGSNLKPGSILGSVKYNPVHWFGVALRPEVVLHTITACVDVNCTTVTSHTATTGRVYGGVEFGWVPGLALSIGGGLLAGLAAVAYAGSN